MVFSNAVSINLFRIGHKVRITKISFQDVDFRDRAGAEFVEGRMIEIGFEGSGFWFFG